MKKFEVTTIASYDIAEIISYIAADNKKAAHSLKKKIISSFSLLADNPNLGHLRLDITKKHVSGI